MSISFPRVHLVCLVVALGAVVGAVVNNDASAIDFVPLVPVVRNPWSSFERSRCKIGDAVRATQTFEVPGGRSMQKSRIGEWE